MNLFALLIAALLPQWELDHIDRISRSYGLDAERKALIISIRRSENGTPPYYYGVSDRRCNTYIRQLKWTSNTIQKRYDGDLEKFAKRWCPVNWKIWLKNVRFFMRRQGYEK